MLPGDRFPVLRSRHGTTPMRRHLAVTAIACAVLSCGQAAHSQQLRTVQAEGRKPENPEKRAEKSVTGTVVDRDNKGLAGAKVTIKGQKVTTVWTDANGSFHFAGRPGAYEVTVKVGEQSQKFPATIDEEEGLVPPTFTIER